MWFGVHPGVKSTEVLLKILVRHSSRGFTRGSRSSGGCNPTNDADSENAILMKIQLMNLTFHHQFITLTPVTPFPTSITVIIQKMMDIHEMTMRIPINFITNSQEGESQNDSTSQPDQEPDNQDDGNPEIASTTVPWNKKIQRNQIFRMYLSC